MAAQKPTTHLPFLQPSPRRAGAAAAYVLWWLSDNIDFSGDCWTWSGAVSGKGYGVIHLKNYEVPERTVLVHRLVYSICVEPIPKNLAVLHRCDNPPCCRPDHLFLGTNQDNIEDKVKKGRQANGQSVRKNHDHLKGEAVVTAVVTADQVMEMRRRDAAGERPSVIARDLGMSLSQVQAIVSGRVWKHLPVLCSGDRRNRTCPKCSMIFPVRKGIFYAHVENCDKETNYA